VILHRLSVNVLLNNNHAFGIPAPYLPIHYTTFVVLRWRLTGVYSENFIMGDFRMFFCGKISFLVEY